MEAKVTHAKLSQGYVRLILFKDRGKIQKVMDKCTRVALVHDFSSIENEGEEETITSASYFDQKYPVTFDANPPMPLFQEHRVAVSEYETNEILKIVEQREENNVKKSISSSATSTTTSPRSSPTNHVIVKKNMRSASKSRLRRSAAANIQQNKQKGKYYDSSVVPLGKSSSVSTEDADHTNRRLRVGCEQQTTTAEI